MLLQEGNYDNRPRSFLIYAPSRTAVVYALAPDDSELAKGETETDTEPEMETETETSLE